jgi:O-antigen ligase
MTSFFRTPIGQISLCVLAAATLLLPGLYFQQFTLAAITLIGLGLAFLLFTRPLYALLAFVIMIPLEQIAGFDTLGTPTRIVGLFFFATYLFHRRFQLNLRVIPLAGWLWMAWVTASLTWSPFFDWTSYFKLLQAFIATLLITDYIARSPKHLNTVLNAYLVVSISLAVLGIYNFFAHVGDVTTFTGSARTEGFGGQGVEHFAFGLIPALYTAFHRLWKVEYRRIRWFNISIILVFIVSILLSGTRGAWMATFGGLLFVYLPRFTLKQYATFALTIILAIVIVFQIPALKEFTRYRSQDAIASGGTGRINIWFVNLEQFTHHPIIGVGWWMGHQTMRLQDFDSSNQSLSWNTDYGRFEPRTAHNIYIQTLVELGLVGFILFIIWLIKVLLPLTHTNPILSDERTLVLGILAAMLVAGISNPELHKKYYWFAVAIAQGVRYSYLQIRLKHSQSNERPPMKEGEVFAALGLVD